jgi:hypothetical protein
MKNEALLFTVLHFIVFSLAILVKNSFRIRTNVRDGYIDQANALMTEMASSYGYNHQDRMISLD